MSNAKTSWSAGAGSGGLYRRTVQGPLVNGLGFQLCLGFSAPVSFCTRVPARMKPPLGHRNSGVNIVLEQVTDGMDLAKTLVHNDTGCGNPKYSKTEMLGFLVG